MSCPAWEDCNKKPCIEQSMCMGDYWVNYWKNKVSVAQQSIGVKTGKRKRILLGPGPCTKKGKYCDKQKTCEFLGQCIFSIKAVQGNKEIIKSLSGKKSMKQVIEVLAKHNPKPMRSYYPNLKKK